MIIDTTHRMPELAPFFHNGNQIKLHKPLSAAKSQNERQALEQGCPTTASFLRQDYELLES